MISQKTAGQIWECYREIAASEKLLADIAEARKDYDRDDPRHERLKDAFGRRRDLQLGVPSGDSCHRIFNVAPTLAESVIRAHIANQQAELAQANEQARVELGQPQHQRSIAIILNGKAQSVVLTSLSYEDAATIAFEKKSLGHGLDPETLTVTWHHGPVEKPSGILGPGERVRLVDGMFVDVIDTSNA